MPALHIGIAINAICREKKREIVELFLHGKNDFAERTKILDTDLKIILLDHQNNFVETLKI